MFLSSRSRKTSRAIRVAGDRRPPLKFSQERETHAPSQCRIQTRTQHQPPPRLAAEPGNVHSSRGPGGDDHHQGQGRPSSRRKADHLGQARRPAFPPPGPVLSADPGSGLPSVRHRGARVTEIVPAAICASCAPASRRAMEPRRPSSNSSVPSTSWTRSARSAPKRAPSAAKKSTRQCPKTSRPMAAEAAPTPSPR